jgi:hypothetical protein
MIETSNQPIRTKIFPKKIYLVPQKCKGAKNSTEFAPSTQNHKKNIGTPNLPIRKTEMEPKFVWRLPAGIRSGSLKNNRNKFCKP